MWNVSYFFFQDKLSLFCCYFNWYKNSIYVFVLHVKHGFSYLPFQLNFYLEQYIIARRIPQYWLTYLMHCKILKQDHVFGVFPLNKELKIIWAVMFVSWCVLGDFLHFPKQRDKQCALHVYPAWLQCQTEKNIYFR